jgi:hypothetical protein
MPPDGKYCVATWLPTVQCVAPANDKSTDMIKTLAITLGILALAIPASAHPKGKGGGKRGEPTAEQKATRAELVAKYDKNGDGQLDEAERAAVSDEDRAKLGGHHGKGKGKGGGKGRGNGKGE